MSIKVGDTIEWEVKYKKIYITKAIEKNELKRNLYVPSANQR